MKKAIVTGAGGFLGIEVCKELAFRGYDVIALVRDEMSVKMIFNTLENVRVLCVDMSDYVNLAKLISDRDINDVYHFAWTGCAGQMRADMSAQVNNIRYTCELIYSCREIGCKRFVFAGSIMEFEVMALMQTDKMPESNTLYSSAKLAADFMAKTLAFQHGIQYIRAIISNVYGPGEKNERFINASLKKLLKGEHCSFSEGNQLYDFLYISDAAKMFVEICEKGINGRTYYIGNKTQRKLKEYLIEMKNCIDKDIEIGLGEYPFNGVELTYLEFPKNTVEEDTGFVPDVSFSKGIKKTIQWLREKNDDFYT